MIKRLIYLAFVFFALSCSNTRNNTENFPALTGNYLGQELPGDSAKLFAPGIISTGMADRDIAITPDGTELFFTRTIGTSGIFTIFHTKVINNEWSKPEVFEFCRDTRYKNTEPFVSGDGKKLLFVSNRSEADTVASYDIWVSEKDENNNWTQPYNLGKPVNTDQNEFFPTLTKDGTIYYNHFDPESGDEFIYRSKLVDGKYSTPEKLNEKINGGRARFNAFISPDESFIIIPTFGMPDSYGATDYYIVFRDNEDNWSEPINMGDQVNSSNGQEWSASLSPDGKYLFFMSARIPENNLTISAFTSDNFNELHNSPQNGLSDIYWVKSGLIDELRQKAKF
ncbi:MAG TPA: hypothetical protein DCG75_19325 [Bacteroidales bacterium]|nr:hypothetical protein [Bacteroidales bacterium]